MSHRYLILGLLTERAMSGYDIKKHVHLSLSAATNAGYGTLYPILHRLLAEGAVEMQEVEQTTRPSKKLYTITQSGREELLRWLEKPPLADQMKREFLLKLYMAESLSTGQLHDLLARRRSETEAQIEALREESQLNSNIGRKWVIQYALSQCEAEIDWLTRLETELAKD